MAVAKKLTSSRIFHRRVENAWPRLHRRWGLFPTAIFLALFVAPVVAAPRFEALLAAGDLEEPVFDNAVRTLGARLAAANPPAARIERLSADDRVIAWEGARKATLPNLTRAIARLHTAADAGCFVFLTSHGREQDGLWLARSRRYLTPEGLDRALSASCGNRPTVTVVSGCYTGAFARAPMARPNRIVLTAARADRPSFGCSADQTYTFFDECFLGALRGAPSWHAIFVRARNCVARREKTEGFRPSEPQAWFGEAVARLPPPWR